MNILPHKSWHVRTKNNIARVRKDQAAALEEERIRQEKLLFAESEARINFLRKQSGIPEHNKSTTTETTTTDVAEASTTACGVDLFADYKSHVKTSNKELEKEKKDEQEKYEKQIGYLTYLGQDTNEALKIRSWYEEAPKHAKVGDLHVTEKDLKRKHEQDPLTLINALLPKEKVVAVPKKIVKTTEQSPLISTPNHTEEQRVDTLSSSLLAKDLHKGKKHKKDKKHKKHKKHKRSKEPNKISPIREEITRESIESKRAKLDQMRRDRLRREAAEKARQDALFAPKTNVAAGSVAATPRIVQKYNSQFNPELAKQNM